MERSSGAAPSRLPRGRRMNRRGKQMNDGTNGDLLSVSVEAAGLGPSVVSLAGELDLSTIPRLEGRLFEELRTRPGVVVDLTKLSFIDSSGIGLLIQAFRA